MEEIIKVDIYDNPVGTIEKLTAHKTPILHRAFSVFLYDGDKILLQKRAENKYHSGGLWANSCCSHQRANTEFFTCVKTRLNHELGINEKINLKELFTFTYLSKYNDNLYEYEFDHVILGKYKQQDINFNKDEISEVKWWKISEIEEQLVKNPTMFSTWFLICAPKVLAEIKKNI